MSAEMLVVKKAAMSVYTRAALTDWKSVALRVAPRADHWAAMMDDSMVGSRVLRSAQH
jgi:hypothetical protein